MTGLGSSAQSATTSRGRYRDLATVRHLPRSPLISYARRRADATRAPGETTIASRSNYPNLLTFLTSNILAWVSNYVRYRFGPRHRFLTYSGPPGDTGIYPLGSAETEIRVSLAGDWASGTDEAAVVGAAIAASRPHYTIHLGDTYYVGDDAEVRSNLLGEATSQYSPTTWPPGSVGSFALNGNHEMYARGIAYFDTLLPKLGIRAHPGQSASFFCLENEYWQIVGLDTGYNSIKWPLLEELNFWPFAPAVDLTRAQMQWLTQAIFARKTSKGLVILTHHPPFSHFEASYPKAAQQLRSLINRPVLWFWGHEHRVAVYGLYSYRRGIEAYGRCVGHGGMPVEFSSEVVDAHCPLLFTDQRTYPNDTQPPVGYNGYANLRFRGNSLGIEYLDLRAQCVFAERWEVDAEGLLHQVAG